MERIPRVIRFPEKLNQHLIREAGERTMKTGKRTTVTDVVIDVLEEHFVKKGRRKRKGVK